jgi:hypothetical protein
MSCSWNLVTCVALHASSAIVRWTAVCEHFEQLVWCLYSYVRWLDSVYFRGQEIELQFEAICVSFWTLSHLSCLCFFCFLARRTLRPWRWRRYDLPKRRTVCQLYSVVTPRENMQEWWSRYSLLSAYDLQAQKSVHSFRHSCLQEDGKHSVFWCRLYWAANASTCTSTRIWGTLLESLPDYWEGWQATLFWYEFPGGKWRMMLPSINKRRH